MKNTTNQHHVFIINAGEQEAHVLQAAAYSVGRDKSNAIVIDYSSISRQHALLLRVPSPNHQGYQYRIVDGNTEGKTSANGIYVNGKRVKSHELKSGDYVSLGKHVRAGYLSLSMGEVELMEYLESISYQSLKTQVLDSKETVVGDDMLVLNEPPSSSVSVLEKINKLESNTPEWVTTQSDSEIPSLGVSSNVSGSDLLDLNQSLKHKSIKLCLAIFGSVLGLSLIGFGLTALLNATKTKSQAFSSGSSLARTLAGAS